jgi:ribonucleoside-diphosphate reductase alpha chain
MYYLRTKSAVDAIKFTVKKKTEAVPVAEVATTPKAKASVAVEPLTPTELKEMLSKSKESEDDDCLMCGS